MWLFLPTSVSSAEPGASTSPSDSLYRRLAASAMWRSSFRQPQFWRRALRMVPWTRLLSGLTYEPSQADSTAGAWLEQFTVSPARTCLSQESKRALRAEIDEAAWAALYSTTSRPFDPPETGKIAVKVINHLGDEVMKVFKID